MNLSLPLNEDQKTRENEPERLRLVTDTLVKCARVIDNIVGTDTATDEIYSAARFCEDLARIIHDAAEQVQRRDRHPILAACIDRSNAAIDMAEAPTPEIAEDAASRADEAERDARTRQYMFERDARQEERRKKNPVLADAAEHAVIVEADKVREKCPILLGPWSCSKTLTDVEEPRPLPKITHHFTVDQIREASDGGAGFCIACGAYNECCEPDARNYRCEECNERQVFGAEELAIMGLVD